MTVTAVKVDSWAGVEAWEVTGDTLPPPQLDRPNPVKPHRMMRGDTRWPNPKAHHFYRKWDHEGWRQVDLFLTIDHPELNYDLNPTFKHDTD